MYHYIAILWNPSTPCAYDFAIEFVHNLRTASPHWQIVFNAPGMFVLHVPSSAGAICTYMLPNQSGVILGRLFPRDLDAPGPSPEVPLSELEASYFFATEGRCLHRHYWGKYIALLVDKRRNLSRVIRDCSGMLPCYWIRFKELTIVFSNIQDLQSLRLPLHINWRYLAAFIHSSQFQIRECAIDGVYELMAGEVLESDPKDAHQTLHWNPVNVYHERQVCNIEAAAEELAYTTQACVDLWASTCRSVLHRLSGGFDSSVVLSCLTRSRFRPSRLVCVNLFSEVGRADERRFARLAAERAGVELVELPTYGELGVLGPELLAMPQMPKPTVSSLVKMLGIDQRNELARSCHADSIWTGQGGDHLFLQLRTPLGVVDYIGKHGISPALAPILRDACRLTGERWWKILYSANREARSTTRWISTLPRTANSALLMPEAIDALSNQEHMHPWSAISSALPKGKQCQLYYLAEVLNRHRPLGDMEYLGEHHALLSQPLIELSLQIPTYTLLQSGRPRGLARYAFRMNVPQEIVDREYKGDTTQRMMACLRDSAPFLRELILDGLLVREGILNRRALEPYLLRGQPISCDLVFPFVASIAAEIWARTWRGCQLRVAA